MPSTPFHLSLARLTNMAMFFEIIKNPIFQQKLKNPDSLEKTEILLVLLTTLLMKDQRSRAP